MKVKERNMWRKIFSERVCSEAKSPFTSPDSLTGSGTDCIFEQEPGSSLVSTECEHAGQSIRASGESPRRREHWSEVIMNLLAADFRRNILGCDSYPDNNNTREAIWRKGGEGERLTYRQLWGKSDFPFSSHALVCATTDAGFQTSKEVFLKI